MEKIYLSTKNNLIKLQKSIKEFKNGQFLLEEKKMILKKKLENYKGEEKKIREELNNIFIRAEETLKRAIVDVGFDELIDITNAIKDDDTISIKYLTLMGVEIPSVVSEELQAELNYGLYHTTAAVDESIIKFVEVKSLIIKLAEIDNTMVRLTKAIEKVQRRSNALKEVIIPRDEKLAQKISLDLEEGERDEIVRLKNVKNKNIRNFK